MTTETLTEKEEKLRRSRNNNDWAISTLTDIAYHTGHHLQTAELCYKFMPTGKLKEFFRVYIQNQSVWQQKMLRVFDDMARNSKSEQAKDMGTDIRNDLKGDELLAYMDTITAIKKAKNMEGMAWLINQAIDIEDMEAIATNLKLILQNQKNKEAV